MTAGVLLRQARRAIEALFTDQMTEPEERKEALLELQDYIAMRIEAIESDIASR